MTKRKPEDLELTRQQLIKCTVDRTGPSWLRHGKGTQAALIDFLILEGIHSLDEIAEIVNEARTKRIDIKAMKARVYNHIAHLLNIHSLPINKEGRVYFTIK